MAKGPKQKTHKGAAKRFKLTGSGKVRRGTAGKQHMMRQKAANRLRNLKKNSLVDDSLAKNIKEMIPYK